MLALSAAAWMFTTEGCRLSTPDLTPAHAAEVMARTREFNQKGTLIAVTGANRETGSMSDCCYNVIFNFKPMASDVDSSGATGTAEFRYWGSDWHLQNFTYLSGAVAESVNIESDQPPNSGIVPGWGSGAIQGNR
jgi:hypothetical protein